MKYFRLLILTMISIVVVSCSDSKNLNNKAMDTKFTNEHFVLATLWMQTAAECKALQAQAFNIGKMRIEDFVAKNKINGKQAIVVDIDETILETSLYQTKMIVENLIWPEGWEEFLKSSNCIPVAGALEFLNFVDSLGIKIFYISNRKENQRKSLIMNLTNYNFPQINNENVLLKTNTSSKEERRKPIVEKYNVLLLMGDSLIDFSDIFDSNNYPERTRKVIENRKKFGDKFIILPNPTYGEWESTLSNNYWKGSLASRDSIRKNILKSLYRDE